MGPESEFIEIRLNLRTGEVTVTDEKHDEIKDQSPDLPKELLEKLNGEVLEFEPLPVHMMWTRTENSPARCCGWAWDYVRKRWYYRCVNC